MAVSKIAWENLGLADNIKMDLKMQMNITIYKAEGREAISND